MNTHRTTIRTVLIVLVVATAGGCQVIPWALDAFAPPEKIDAKHHLPDEKKLLVLVVDSPQQRQSREHTGPVRQHLTQHLNNQLIANEVVDEVVAYDDVLDLMIADPQGFEELSDNEIGEKLGAGRVLRVEVTTFSLKDSEINPLWHGQLHTLVRVLDDDGRTIWPDDRPKGFPVQPVELKSTNEATPAYSEKLTQLLAVAMADHVAKLFYDHEIDPHVMARREREEYQRVRGMNID